MSKPLSIEEEWAAQEEALTAYTDCLQDVAAGASRLEELRALGEKLRASWHAYGLAVAEEAATAADQDARLGFTTAFGGPGSRVLRQYCSTCNKFLDLHKVIERHGKDLLLIQCPS